MTSESIRHSRRARMLRLIGIGSKGMVTRRQRRSFRLKEQEIESQKRKKKAVGPGVKDNPVDVDLVIDGTRGRCIYLGC